MINMTLQDLKQILNLQIDHLPKNLNFQGLSFDTRNIKANNLFIALKGERVDGHNYLDDAYQKKASFALVSHQTASKIPQLPVPDTIQALGKIASAWRNQFKLPIIAVTGSNGKTTLKNLITSILIAACDDNKAGVLSNAGNFNNHLGLPLTLSRLNHRHQFGVLEMGMNHFGEIAYLTQLARPKIAVISNAGAAHLEGVGSLQGVAKAKSEIFQGLSSDGVAILNRDDPFYTYWQEQIGSHAYLTFGMHDKAHIRASLTETKQQDVFFNHSPFTNQHHLTLHTPSGECAICLPLLGKHNVMNALAAAAVAISLHISLDHIKKGLEAVQPAPGRLQLHTLSNGVTVIDDTYNANPFSLNAAIKTLASFHGKKILVLGDMRELGQEEKDLHYHAGENIRSQGIDYLFTYGQLSQHTAIAFGEGAYHFYEQEKLIQALKPFLHHPTTILIKGARLMRMEKVVQELIQ